MKNNKHIRYLKIVISIVSNNIYFFIGFMITFSIFLLLEPLEPILTKILNYISSNHIIIDEKHSSIIQFVLEVLLSVLLGEILNLILEFFTKSKKEARLLQKSVRRNWIYTHFYRLYKKYNPLNYLSLLFINVFVHGRPINYHNQNEHIQSLTNRMLESTNDKHIIWVVGEAYSGKTTTVFRFLENIAQEQPLFEKYEKNIYYFDLGNNQFSTKKLINDIELRKYINSLIILDNVHKLNNHDLVCFIVGMESCHHNVDRIICLSRELESFCYSQETFERLSDFINKNTERLDIKSSGFKISESKFLLEEIKLHLNVKEFEKFCLQTIGDTTYSNPIMILQCYNLYWLSNSKIKKKYVIDLFKAINNATNHSIKTCLLSFIIHASLFSGGFEDSWIDEYIKKSFTFPTNIFAKFHLKLLKETGFISTTNGTHINWFAFHEQIAKIYFKEILTYNKYYDANSDIIKYLIIKNKELKNYANAWKYSIILDINYKDTDKLFDKALEYVNFKTFLEDTIFICDSMKLNSNNFLQNFGILYDRIGELSKSAEYFDMQLKINFDPVVYINYIQVDHSQYSDEAIQLLLKHHDPYCNLAAMYWKLHIDLHDGIFSFKAFSDMLDIFIKEKSIIISNQPYYGKHLLRRWYFDCFRCYYLSGQLNPYLLSNIMNSEISQELEQLVETEAYNIKFRKAFYLHYDILFLIGVLEKYSFDEYEKWDSVMLGENKVLPLKMIAQKYECSIMEYIAKQAEEYYIQSSVAMKNIMDKSYRYSDLRIWELQLAKDNVTITDIKNNEVLLGNYIEHSTNIKIDEYVAYGYTYLLKTYLVGLFSYDTEYDDNTLKGSTKDNLYISDEKITNCFENIKMYHDKYRDSRNNEYCMFRLELYKTLYSIISNKNKNPLDAIKTLKTKAENKNYHRETMLLEVLIKNNCSRLTIKNIFKYYPLVLQ